MHKNFNLPIREFDGREAKGPEGKEIQMKDVIVSALLSNSNDSPNGEEKFARYLLAIRVAKIEGDDYNVDDLAKIKKLVGQVCTPLVVGQIWSHIEAKLPLPQDGQDK